MDSVEDYLMNNDAKIIVHSWLRKDGVEYEATLLKMQYDLSKPNEKICQVYSLVSFEDALRQLNDTIKSHSHWGEIYSGVEM